MDVEAVLDACAEAGTAVEISGEPYRLDLEERWHGAARSRGVRAVLSADAHDFAALDDAILAVGTARRGGWRRDEILNTMATDDFRSWCRGKTERSADRWR
jgi:DNA polymerase (family 10)